MNQAYLSETREVPPRFMQEVRRVTTQIVVMLLPMYNMVGQADARKAMPFERFFQKLLRIVAYAAWINVMTRSSPEILAIEWLSPGDEYRLSQVNFMNERYTWSRLRARSLDGEQQQRHPRMARIKINGAPKITRLTRVSTIDGELGRREYTVLRPHVVYYHGLLDVFKDRAGLAPLADYVLNVRSAYSTSTFSLIGILAYIVLLLLVSIAAWYIGKFIAQPSELLAVWEEIREMGRRALDGLFHVHVQYLRAAQWLGKSYR